MVIGHRNRSKSVLSNSNGNLIRADCWIACDLLYLNAQKGLSHFLGTKPSRKLIGNTSKSYSEPLWYFTAIRADSCFEPVFLLWILTKFPAISRESENVVRLYEASKCRNHSVFFFCGSAHTCS